MGFIFLYTTSSKIYFLKKIKECDVIYIIKSLIYTLFTSRCQHCYHNQLHPQAACCTILCYVSLSRLKDQFPSRSIHHKWCNDILVRLLSKKQLCSKDILSLWQNLTNKVWKILFFKTMALTNEPNVVLRTRLRVLIFVRNHSFSG